MKKVHNDVKVDIFSNNNLTFFKNIIQTLFIKEF